MAFAFFFDVLIIIKKLTMKKINYFIFTFVFVCLFSACKKNHDQQAETPKGTELPKGVNSKDVQIILPENSPVDLSTCEIFSRSFQSPVDKKGKAKAAFNKGYPNIAYVFDKNDNVIMAGFITDSTNTISVGSTAEVLLYFGMGTTFQPHEIMEKFISGIGKVPGVAEWKTQVEGMFKKDPLMMQKGLFADALKTKVEAIIKTGTVLRRPADITVVNSEKKSGLQLAEKGFNQFTFTNTFRRRSQAFIYKMNYKDLAGVSHTVNNNIYGSVTSIADLKISPTSAIRDFKGVLQDWAAGKGMDFAAVTFGPVNIPLEDNESEANFKVRVVGPGVLVLDAMTSYEKERLVNLQLQTIAFDYLLPVMLDVIGAKETLGNDLSTFEKFVKGTGDYIATIPAASDAIESGNYSKGFLDIISAIENAKAGGAFDEWIKLLYESVGNAVKKMGSDYIEEQPEFLAKRAEHLIKVLQVVDIGMKIIDYGRINADILRSKTLEEWDLKAKEVQLNMDPKEFSISPLDQKKITAFIKTTIGDNVVVEYEWSTTGKYGYLWDDRGHKGTSFSSSIKEAFYLCNEKESDLGPGKHTDTIKVTAYLKSGQTRTKIASGTSIANVGKDVFFPGWTPDNGINKFVLGNGDIEYNVGPPSFYTEFDEKENARDYKIEVIDKAGNILDTRAISPYTSPAMTREKGKVKITLRVGRMFFITGIKDEATMLISKKNNEQLLNEYPGNGFKVTVIH